MKVQIMKSEHENMPEGFIGHILETSATPEGVVYLIGEHENDITGEWFPVDDVREIKDEAILVSYHARGIEMEKHGDWIDLKAAKDYKYGVLESFKVDLGVSMMLPKGYEAHVLPRSSTFERYGIIMTNSMGIIDGDFCGDDDVWRFPAFSLKSGEIHKGDRICQFRLVKRDDLRPITSVRFLRNQNRGGFGSSGR